MITISVCMIVKNEETILRRCLDSLQGLYDELIIADTGSFDRTMEIAREYTDQVCSFQWVNDFACARNFVMEKATCDYIYMADADEVIDSVNRERFATLKRELLPEIDIVQMRYVNQLANGTVYNFDEEYRPKLYKRLRTFHFIDPIHEMVRLDPVVYDSDIDICHIPTSVHTSRDITIFEKMIEEGTPLSNRLVDMYIRELMVSGEKSHFLKATPYFQHLCEETKDNNQLKGACAVLVKAAYLSGNDSQILKYALKDIVVEGCSEVCCILGQYFEDHHDDTEAAMWYYNARYETEPITALSYGSKLPLEGLVRCYEKMGDYETSEKYKKEIEN